jgi:hypothetical protein
MPPEFPHQARALIDWTDGQVGEQDPDGFRLALLNWRYEQTSELADWIAASEGVSLLAGLSPAGMTASLAARSLWGSANAAKARVAQKIARPSAGHILQTVPARDGPVPCSTLFTRLRC